MVKLTIEKELVSLNLLPTITPSIMHLGSSYLLVISIDLLPSLWHFSKDISSIVSYLSIIRKPPTLSRSVIAATSLIIYLSRLFKGHGVSRCCRR